MSDDAKGFACMAISGGCAALLAYVNLAGRFRPAYVVEKEGAA